MTRITCETPKLPKITIERNPPKLATSGARIPPTRPIAEAIPNPIDQTGVGYNSEA